MSVYEVSPAHLCLQRRGYFRMQPLVFLHRVESSRGQDQHKVTSVSHLREMKILDMDDRPSEAVLTKLRLRSRTHPGR